jgi:hypothetical protein
MYPIYWERLGKPGEIEPFFEHPFALNFATVAETREILKTMVSAKKCRRTR